MLTALGMIGLVAMGIVIGRHPDFLWRHSSFFLSGPKLLCFWLFGRIKRNPAVIGGFFTGFFAALLVSGGLSRIIWNTSLVGLLVFCLLIFFPTMSGKIAQKAYDLTRFCAERIGNFFAVNR